MLIRTDSLKFFCGPISFKRVVCLLGQIQCPENVIQRTPLNRITDNRLSRLLESNILAGTES